MDGASKESRAADESMIRWAISTAVSGAPQPIHQPRDFL
jgi:hypothetical protein